MPSLRQLHYALFPFAQQLFAIGRANDPSLRVTSVRRSYQEQARLYATYLAGKSTLPAAPPGKSMHQFGLAFDMARPGVEPHNDSLLVELGKIWNEAGGHWSPSDPVHFEVR